nr:NB-ARC domains-containing protein [Tanacetum cinerariifolium]
RLETPTRVKEWLDEVKKIKIEVDKILPGRVDSKHPASTSTSDVEDCLDDVWRESKIKLKDIGLARPLPKGVKLLLTSRDESICREIAVDAGFVPEVVSVDVLKEGEARDLFCWIADISAENDLLALSTFKVMGLSVFAIVIGLVLQPFLKYPEKKRSAKFSTSVDLPDL